jgi:septum formation protein
MPIINPVRWMRQQRPAKKTNQKERTITTRRHRTVRFVALFRWWAVVVALLLASTRLASTIVVRAVTTPRPYSVGAVVQQYHYWWQHRHHLNNQLSSSLLLVRRPSAAAGRPFSPLFGCRSRSSSSSNMAYDNNNDGGGDNDKNRLMVSLRSYLTNNNEESSKETDDNGNSKNKIRLILASQSPRRREILDMMGLQDHYVVRLPPSSTFDETALQQSLDHDDPIWYVQTLADAKANAMVEAIRGDDPNDPSSTTTTAGGTIILAADTIVVLVDNNKTSILEKPTDRAQAVRMLSQLSGRTHLVHTAVAVHIVLPASTASTATAASLTSLTSSLFIDTAQVTFATLSAADIAAYVADGEPMDKAGSYGIQGRGGQFVQNIHGDFFTVMGLPMHQTSRALAKAVETILAATQNNNEERKSRHRP